MNITAEMVTLYMAITGPIVGGILGGIITLWKKLDSMQKDINKSVTHDVCEKRRKSCPCHRDVEWLKKQVKK